MAGCHGAVSAAGVPPHQGDTGGQPAILGADHRPRRGRRPGRSPEEGVHHLRQAENRCVRRSTLHVTHDTQCWPFRLTGGSRTVSPTGFLSYLHDPTGCRSILSRPFPNTFAPTTLRTGGKANGTDFIRSFSQDPTILAFAQHFCRQQGMLEHPPSSAPASAQH